ncbi:hypothetical protein ALC62_07334 [Cyphomyrmex costatus]|uniref:Uncharacterized protein n=1 Tax=Cyphomyrmex costatus TaxID=456900 RepID=A0A195CN20_9HYME|nr:hypothetical protein ALC62_07334 [Cyphomyrmex costatus]
MPHTSMDTRLLSFFGANVCRLISQCNMNRTGRPEGTKPQTSSGTVSYVVTQEGGQYHPGNVFH